MKSDFITFQHKKSRAARCRLGAICGLGIGYGRDDMRVSSILGEGRLVALGSAHGSDVIGWAVARVLYGGQPPDACLLSTPAELARWLEDEEGLVILDALFDESAVPGTVREVSASELEQGFALGSHGPGLAEMLGLRRVLCPAGAPWRVYGIRVRPSLDIDDVTIAKAATVLRDHWRADGGLEREA